MAQASKPGPSKAEGGQTNGAMRIDPKLVHELAALLTDNELTEIEVEDGDRRIKVKREPAAIFGAEAPAPAVAQPLEAPPTHGKEDLGEETEVSGQAIKSPMVGTAYLSAEPSSKPFVTVGEAVKAGDTLLIVEAMKVMNPITAPTGGVVKKILVADAQPVEFDQPLVVIG
jgi:acetyl-CoA carboxylase biotin carboxyl carrier protein